MAKNLFSGLILSPLTPFGPKAFFPGFYLYQVLDISASYHCIQFQGKLMSQTLKNGKNTSFGPNFAPFWSKLGHQKYFWQALPPLHVRHCCQLLSYTKSRTTKDPNLRKWEKPSFGTNFGLFGPNLGHQLFYKKFCLRQLLDIMVSYHHVQYQKKIIIQFRKNLVMDGQTERQTDG